MAAEAAFDAVASDRSHDELASYASAFESSWLHAELNKARNFKQWFKKGRTVGTFMTGIEQWLLKGKFPGPCATTSLTMPACSRHRSAPASTTPSPTAS